MADKLHPKIELIKKNYESYNRFMKSIESGHEKAIPLGIDKALKEKIKELEAAGKVDLAKNYKEYDLLKDVENHELIAKHIMKVFDDLIKREYSVDKGKAGKEAYMHIMKATQNVDHKYFERELNQYKEKYSSEVYRKKKDETLDQARKSLQPRIWEGIKARHLEDIVGNGMGGKKIFSDLKIFNNEQYIPLVADIAKDYDPDTNPLDVNKFHDGSAFESKLKGEYQSKDFKNKLAADKKANEKEQQQYRKAA